MGQHRRGRLGLLVDAFKVIQDPRADSQTITRLQLNVATWARQFDAPTSVRVLDIVSSTSNKTYQANQSDAYIAVNARGGPMKIILPAPGKATMAVQVMNVYATANPVTIAIASGVKFPDGAAEIALAPFSSASMVCNGSVWMRFGVL